MASSTKTLKKGVWDSYTPVGDGVTQITHNSGNTTIIYCEKKTQPGDKHSISNYSEIRDSIYFFELGKLTSIWFMPLNDDAEITITVETQ